MLGKLNLSERAQSIGLYPHYAWVIVATVTIVQMVGSSIRSAFGVLVDPMVETFGWSQNSVGAAYAFSSIISALFAPISGRLGDRYGGRRVMLLGGAMLVSGLMLTGASNNLWQFYIGFGVLMGIAQSIFMVNTISGVSVWFRRQLGVGIGLMALSGLGAAFAAPVMGLLISHTSWQTAFWAAAVASGAIIFSLLIILFRDDPSAVGLKPYGATEDDPPQITTRNGALSSIRAKTFQSHVKRTQAFWNLIAVHFLGCVGHAIVLVWVIPLATHQGLSLVAAGGILSIISVVSIVTRFITPVVADHMGSKGVMGLAFFMQGATVLMLFWAHDIWFFYLFALLFGIAFGGEMSAFPIINRQYYGHGPLGNTYGWQMLGSGIGMGLGGWIGGPIFDLTGSYDLAIWLSAAFSLGGALAIALLEPTSRMLIPNWEESLPPEARSAA